MISTGIENEKERSLKKRKYKVNGEDIRKELKTETQNS